MGKKTQDNNDKLFKLLNIGVTDSNQKLDEEAILKLVKEDPKVCEVRYPVESISLELIYPLHAVCSLSGSLDLVKRVYKAYPKAIEDNTTTIGNVLHYCCTFDTNIEIVNFICVKYPKCMEEVTTEEIRTPLHTACAVEAKYEIVAYLTEKYPEACKLCDREGFTPLHLACDSESSNLAVVEDLTEVCPEACTMQAIDQSTPLHLAIKKSVDLEVIKDLLRANKEATKIKDDIGRLPIHVAVDMGCTSNSNPSYTMELLKILTVKYPDALEIENKDGLTPHQQAKANNLRQDIVEYLNPYEEE